MYILFIITIINGGVNISTTEFDSLISCQSGKTQIESVLSEQPPAYIECVAK